MFEPEGAWHDFEAMIEEFSDSEMPSESAATEAVFADRKDNDSDSELYLSDSAMSEDSQLNLNLISCQLYRLPTSLLLYCDQSSTRCCTAYRRYGPLFSHTACDAGKVQGK